MTATERVYKGGKENEILSMDDPQDYGNTLYQMTYKQAIDANVVSDYKIVSFNVTNAEYREIIQNNEYIRLNKNPKQNDDVTARELATALALRKTFKKLKISKALSFHSSIRRADKFEDLNKQINKDFKKYPSIETYHVSSRQKSSDRFQEMRSFEQSNKSLMTNARCLTEGVDVPAIDCVAFIDSKRSKIDIVQAAGRAMRKSRDKKYGYVLVPLITNNNDVKSASIDTEYEDLISVITSLATQDERLIDEIKSIVGKTIKKKHIPKIIQSKTSLLNKIDKNDFSKNIILKVWRNIQPISYCNYEEAKKYVNKFNFETILSFKDHLRKNKILDIPLKPNITYRNKGWKSWKEFIGKTIIADQNKKEFYLDYKKASLLVIRNKILTRKEYTSFVKGKTVAMKLPHSPPSFYNKKWISWSNFLGVRVNEKREYREFHKAKKFFKKIKLKSLSEWEIYSKINRKKIPYDIPIGIHQVYSKHKDWRGLNDFFSNKGVDPKKVNENLIPFNSAKKIIQKFNLKNNKEWRIFSKSKRFPKNLTKIPDRVYKGFGWNGWGDFLGNNNSSKNIDINKKFYWSYNKTKKYLKDNGISNEKKFREAKRIKSLPERVPKTPDLFYSKFGQWKGWGAFFSKN